MTTQTPGVPSRRYRLYQFCVRSDFALSAVAAGDSPCDIEFVRAGPNEPRLFEPTVSTLRYHNTASGAQIHIRDSFCCLRYSNVADFFISDARHVRCHVDPEATETLIVALLQGPVCALLLELRGFACLHASAVQINGRAVAFIGHTGAGKSSFAMHFVARGAPLVSDDILALTVDGDSCLAAPGYPEIKLCQDMAARLAPHGNFQPELQKHVQAVSSFTGQPVPLAVAYLLEREPQRQPPVLIDELRPSERFVEMLRFSFCSGAVGPLGLEATRFHQLGRIAELIAVRRLRYASDIDRLGLACDAILSDYNLGRTPSRYLTRH